MDRELTDLEKVEIYNTNLQKYESDFTFDLKKLELETEESEYMDYIKWELNFKKRMNEVGYVQKPNIIQGEICQYCNSYGQPNIFESVGQLIKHMYKCKYNPQNINKINNVNFDCKFCSHALSNLYNKKVHENICKSNPLNIKRINNINFDCEFCYRALSNLHNKQVHEKICKSNPLNIERINNINFDCIYCNKFITNLNNKKLHEGLCKMNPKNKNPIEYNCKFCLKYMGNEYNLNLHQNNCDNNPENIKKNEDNIKNLKETHLKLTCKGCNRFLKHQILYDLHIKQCKKYADYIVNEALKTEDDYINIDFDNITDAELNILVQNTLK
jgi:hypothetical protein